MPCYATGSAEGDANLALSEAQEEATRVTEMLCSVMRNLDILGQSTIAPGNVQDWWKRHKKLDRQRAERDEREKQKAQAIRLKRLKTEIANLSQDEKEALGLS